MNPTLSQDDFNRLTAILAARPGFANPTSRYAYVTAFQFATAFYRAPGCDPAQTKLI